MKNKRRRGQGLVEYALLVSLLALSVLGAFKALAGTIDSSVLGGVTSSLNSTQATIVNPGT